MMMMITFFSFLPSPTHIRSNNMVLLASFLKEDLWILNFSLNVLSGGDCSGVVVNVFNCGIVVREFDLVSRYYVYYWTSTFVKDMNLLISFLMG